MSESLKHKMDLIRVYLPAAEKLVERCCTNCRRPGHYARTCAYPTRDEDQSPAEDRASLIEAVMWLKRADIDAERAAHARQARLAYTLRVRAAERSTSEEVVRLRLALDAEKASAMLAFQASVGAHVEETDASLERFKLIADDQIKERPMTEHERFEQRLATGR